MKPIKIAIILIIIICILLLYLRKSSEGFTAENAAMREWNQNTELIIVSSHFNEDLNWLLKAPVPVVVCGKDGEKPAAIPTNEACKTINEGYEASSYLKFIIANYENLPQYVLFLHGHENAHHQKRDIFEEIKQRKWFNKPYYSVNKFGLIQCMNGSIHMCDQLRPLWDTYFRPYLKRDAPKNLVCDCCAQFVISRDTILKNPKEAYEKWLQLLIEDYKKYSDIFKHTDQTMHSPGKQIAMLFEYLWHIIFGQPDEMTEL
jgi:hypothetical protein